MAKKTPIKFIDGIVQMGVALYNKKALKDAQKEARDNLREEMDAFRSLDTSNPYADLENAYEDLTVNTQEDTAQQSQANILASLRGAAGSSGIGSLAQTLANQASIDARRSSASIGAQEAQNQRLAAQGAASVQSQKAYGQYLSQQMEIDKQSTLTGIAQTEMQQANANRQANQEMFMEGLGTVSSAAIGMPYKGGVGKPKKKL